MRCFVCKETGMSSSYHVFPKDPEIRKQWLEAFKFEERDILGKTRVCGKHFSKSCFIGHKGRSFLIKGSIPSLLLRKQKRKQGYETESQILKPQENVSFPKILCTYALNEYDSTYYPVSAFEPPILSQSTSVLVKPQNVESKMEHKKQFKVVDISTIRDNKASVVSTQSGESSLLNMGNNEENQIELGAVSSNCENEVHVDSAQSENIDCIYKEIEALAELDVEQASYDPDEARKKFRTAIQAINSFRHKIKMLNQQIKRLSNKEKHLKTLVRVAKAEKSIQELCDSSILISPEDEKVDEMEQLMSVDATEPELETNIPVDHDYQIKEKGSLQDVLSRNSLQKKRIRTLQQLVRRQKTKIDKLHNLAKKLIRKNMLNEQCEVKIRKLAEQEKLMVFISPKCTVCQDSKLNDE